MNDFQISEEEIDFDTEFELGRLKGGEVALPTLSN